ncbi:hypothetical protein [Paracoccus litorisediminis]|uniref:Uncharacterized protein n=1 Tax=Paracoccus litorisediminis TaxID=2006130 RepID=A0A844HNM3_9RHOB|nr:hypothetical protein [Paracoccus litorisediminis]MTH60689.1 hypothetical protein [Paracoccus litorisediminis]
MRWFVARIESALLESLMSETVTQVLQEVVMKRMTVVLALTVLVGACASSDTGTSAIDDAQPLTARMTVVPENGAHTITMTSRAGYTCTAVFDQKAYMASKQASIQVPVTCDNGDSGTATYTNLNYRQQAFTPGQTQITYELVSGKKGMIAL